MSILRTQDDLCYTVYDFSMKATLRMDKTGQAFHIFDSELALLYYPVYGIFSSVTRMRSRYMIQNPLKRFMYSMMLVLINCTLTDSGYVRFVRIFRFHIRNHIYKYTNIADVLLLNSLTSNVAQPFQFDGYELSIEINKSPSSAIKVEFERRFNVLNNDINNIEVQPNLNMVREYHFRNLMFTNVF